MWLAGSGSRAQKRMNLKVAIYYGPARLGSAQLNSTEAKKVCIIFTQAEPMPHILTCKLARLVDIYAVTMNSA